MDAMPFQFQENPWWACGVVLSLSMAAVLLVAWFGSGFQLGKKQIKKHEDVTPSPLLTLLEERQITIIQASPRTAPAADPALSRPRHASLPRAGMTTAGESDSDSGWEYERTGGRHTRKIKVKKTE